MTPIHWPMAHAPRGAIQPCGRPYKQSQLPSLSVWKPPARRCALWAAPRPSVFGLLPSSAFRSVFGLLAFSSSAPLWLLVPAFVYITLASAAHNARWHAGTQPPPPSRRGFGSVSSALAQGAVPPAPTHTPRTRLSVDRRSQATRRGRRDGVAESHQELLNAQVSLEAWGDDRLQRTALVLPSLHRVLSAESGERRR